MTRGAGVLFYFSLLLGLNSVHGQATQRPPLPTNPGQWLNSGPLAYEGMHGKAAVLWYFEETCPKCAGLWTSLKELAAQYADQPVLFIGVNSGTDPSQVAAYLKKHDIDWPVIVDYDRAFEQASGVQEISLQNIYQVRVVTADGGFGVGRWDDLKGTVERVLKDASWKVKYDRLPPSMHFAVHRLEYGDYRAAAKAVRDGLAGKSPPERRAAAQIQQQVERLMKQAIAAAISGAPGDDVWSQFEARERVAERFAPFKLPADEAAALETLRADKRVQQELKAAKAVSANEPLLSSPDEVVRNRAIGRLRRVLESFPDTRAAARVQELLSSQDAAH